MVMLPYSIVSSLDYYRKLYQPNKYVLKDNLRVSHTIRGGAQSGECVSTGKNLTSKKHSTAYQHNFTLI
jgi:hypothetical protein